MAELLSLNARASLQSDAFMKPIEDMRGGLRRLVNSLDPARAAIERHNRGVKELENAYKSGILSGERFERYMGELKRQTDAAAAGMQRMASTSGAARAGLQQVGFQAQDFIVQVAGGTSAMRAFSVQAPQMIGGLQLMFANSTASGTAMARLGSIIGGPVAIAAGVAIPLIGMLAERYFTAGKAADTAANSMKEFARLRDVAFPKDSNADNVASARRILGARVAELKTAREQLERLRPYLGKMQGEEVFRGRSGPQYAGPARGAPTLASLGVAMDRVKQLTRDVQEGSAVLNRLVAKARPETAAATALGAARQAGASAGSATTSIKAQSDAAREAMQSNAALAASIEALRSKYDPLGTAARQASEDIGKIYEMIRAGSVDTREGLSWIKEAAGGDGTAGSLDAFMRQYGDVRDLMKKMADEQPGNAEKIKRSWTDAAQGVTSALRGLENAVSGGGALDILASLMNVFEVAGKAGWLGKKIEGNLNSPPGRAVGGPVSGGSPYIVGERGPELFVPSRSGQIVTNDRFRQIVSGGDSRLTVEVFAGPQFDTHVSRVAGNVAAPMAVRAAQAGGDMGEARVLRRQRNRLP